MLESVSSQGIAQIPCTESKLSPRITACEYQLDLSHDTCKNGLLIVAHPRDTKIVFTNPHPDTGIYWNLFIHACDNAFETVQPRAELLKQGVFNQDRLVLISHPLGLPLDAGCECIVRSNCGLLCGV